MPWCLLQGNALDDCVKGELFRPLVVAHHIGVYVYRAVACITGAVPHLDSRSAKSVQGWGDVGE